MTEENTLEIPAFLDRQKKQEEPEMTAAERTLEAAKGLLPEGKKVMTLDECLERIKELTAKKEALTRAISFHKKEAQRMIGRM